MNAACPCHLDHVEIQEIKIHPKGESFVNLTKTLMKKVFLRNPLGFAASLVEELKPL